MASDYDHDAAGFGQEESPRRYREPRGRPPRADRKGRKMFNLTMSQTEYAKLWELALGRGVSMAEVLRALVRDA